MRTAGCSESPDYYGGDHQLRLEPVPVLSDAQAVPVVGFARFFLVWPAILDTAANGNPYA